jgi:hypothetical protein
VVEAWWLCVVFEQLRFWWKCRTMRSVDAWRWCLRGLQVGQFRDANFNVASMLLLIISWVQRIAARLL